MMFSKLFLVEKEEEVFVIFDHLFFYPNIDDEYPIREATKGGNSGTVVKNTHNIVF